MIDQALLLIAGLTAGIVGGLLGIGGGVVLMPILRFVIGLSPVHAVGTCVLAVFFTTLGGGFRHYRLGHVPVRSLVPVIVSGALSSIVFSMVFVYLARDDWWLDLGIGIVFLLVSTRMIMDGVRNGNDGSIPVSTTNGLLDSKSRKVILGSLAGILPGLFGIGTGAILVPGFIYLLNTATKIAIGSSLVCFAINAFISVIMKSAQGYVEFGIAIPVCIGTLVGSQIGAIINHRTPSVALRVIFGLVFTGVSIRFILSALEVFK
ncbi:sulfite exporter TauE/SafE family protein [bacterium]|nr:sulfite exporter TauE/SafE family protein [bacterium]